MSESTTPLLLPKPDSSCESPHQPVSLDEAMEQCIGDFSWAQFIQVFLVSLAWVFDAQQTFISVFTDTEPGSDISIPTSIISEFGLENASSLIKGLPASSFYMGCLAGGFVLASLADSSLGRKNMLFLTCLTMSLSSFSTIFSTNVWIYSFWKFINGFSRATIGTSALVLSTELVGNRYRGQVGTIGFVCFTLGFLSLPGIAYINRGSSWRNMYLYASIPTMLYSVLALFFIRESPRWLFVQGRQEEALSILKTVSGSENIDFSKVCLAKENSHDDIFSAVKILMERKWAMKRLSAVMISAFGIGMVYYGMPLGFGNLSFNLYLSVTLNALSEIPSSLVLIFLIGKVNRKSSLIFFTVLSGICSVMCVVVGKMSVALQIGLEMVSFFSACTAFGIAIIYTLELFPTCVRNSAVSLARQAVVLGGVFGPVLVAAGRKNEFLSFGVFGLVIGICGLSVIGLPETRGVTISDTLEEQEYKERTATCSF